MMDEYHNPVMPAEVLKFLITDPDGCYVDGTLGGGGHTERILEKLSPEGMVIGFDADIDSIEHVTKKFADKSSFKNRIIFINENFADLKDALNNQSVNKNIKGVLLDLGVSSFQIDNPEKGFMYRQDAVLDMRMDRSRGVPAHHILNSASENELIRIFRDYGEDKNPRALAKLVIDSRRKKQFLYSGDLVDIIKSFIGGPKLNKVASRIFQSLRIEVNDELENLSSALEQAVEVLSIGGRLVVISYHSLEDKIVKNFFREKAKGCVCPPSFPKCICGKEPMLKILTSKPVIASEDEIETNNRARSAKLRVAERI
jgi:16S rRNA (cytosine1402-N4)-methyltransferase